MADVLRKTAAAVLGEGMEAHVAQLREMVAKSAVDDLAIRDYPFVTLRTNANTWLECTVVYLVPPKQATAIRTAILKQALGALLKEPDKVMFPKGNAR